MYGQKDCELCVFSHTGTPWFWFAANGKTERDENRSKSNKLVRNGTNQIFASPCTNTKYVVHNVVNIQHIVSNTLVSPAKSGRVVQCKRERKSNQHSHKEINYTCSLCINKILAPENANKRAFNFPNVCTTIGQKFFSTGMALSCRHFYLSITSASDHWVARGRQNKQKCLFFRGFYVQIKVEM